MSERWRGYWAASEIWKDRDVFIIGGGPSLKEMGSLSCIWHRPVIGVNNAFELGPWIDVIYFGDRPWWKRHGVRALAHPGMIVTSYNSRKGLLHPDIKTMGRANRQGLHWRSNTQLCWNRNSGASAINLAYHFGARRIILLGFDMKKREGAGNRGHNWHEYHASYKAPRGDIYQKKFLPGFNIIKMDLETIEKETGRKVEILNATPDSDLVIFPMVDLRDVA